MIAAALDTAVGASLAIACDGRVIHRAHLAETSRHSDAGLVPWLAREFHLQGLAVPDVARWTVGTGPGSFSGVRVGIALVQGLCAATRARCRGLPSSVALALELADRHGAPRPCRLGVLHDARRHQIIVGTYGWNGTRLEAQDAPRVVHAEDLRPGEPADCDWWVTVQAGEIVPLLDADVRQRVLCLERLDAARLLDPPGWDWPPDAEADPASMEPVYVRPAVFVAPKLPVR